MNGLHRLQEPTFWLLSLAATIAALHLVLVDRANNPELLGTSLLFWLAAGSLLWDKRTAIVLHSGAIATLTGVLILTVLLLKGASLPDSNSFLRFFPLLSVLGWCLLASGLKRLRVYWKELFLFGLLAFHPLLTLILQLVDLPVLTAKSATFMLWYAGFQVQRQGVFLLLPTGRVEVYGACSGLESILQMLNIAVLFLLLVPIRRNQQALCVSVAVLLGFLVNSLRVALMAILVAFSHKSAFEYWHSGDGSLVFSMIAVLLFGSFCWIAFLRPSSTKPDPETETNV